MNTINRLLLLSSILILAAWGGHHSTNYRHLSNNASTCDMQALGYYGENALFGSTPIVGEWSMKIFNGEKYQVNYIVFLSDGRAVANIPKRCKVHISNTYGVSEDKKSIKFNNGICEVDKKAGRIKPVLYEVKILKPLENNCYRVERVSLSDNSSIVGTACKL